jgi:hypothetical protein
MNYLRTTGVFFLSHLIEPKVLVFFIFLSFYVKSQQGFICGGGDNSFVIGKNVTDISCSCLSDDGTTKVENFFGDCTAIQFTVSASNVCCLKTQGKFGDRQRYINFANVNAT